MGCGGDREKGPPEQSQKWDYITLSDFKSTSAWNGFAYAWLWLMAVVSIGVYAADTYTAVNLLAFNHWTSKIQPVLDIKYSRWIFAGTILFSWALCILEWIRALRAIKRGGVAESYMDPLAVTLQSMRSQGWRRFLVFSALTKSRKGADYVAFFVYFQFKGAIRILLAEGPRVVINAMTLYAVAQKDLFTGATEEHSWIVQFWLNTQNIFNTNKLQAATMITMAYTAIIWIFSALSLISAALCYLLFLWHYIPQQDGRLSIYCRRKVDKRLEKIVEVKVKAAIEEETRLRRKAEQKAELKRQKTGELLPPERQKIARQPTLPQMGATPEMKSDDNLSEFTLARQDTSASVATLPLYSQNNSEPDLQRQPTLPDFHDRPLPSRMQTDASAQSNMSYESNAPLLANAGYAGAPEYSQPSRPPTAFSRQDSNSSFGRPMPSRTMTQDLNGKQRSYTPMSRRPTPGSQRSYTPVDDPQQRQSVGPRMPVRTNTGFSFEQGGLRSAITPGPPVENGIHYPTRQNTNQSFGAGSARYDSPAPDQIPLPISRQQRSSTLHNAPSFTRPVQQRTTTPLGPPRLQQADSYEMLPQPPYTARQPPPFVAFQPPAQAERQASPFVAFNPSLHTTTPQPGPQRSVTIAGGPGTEQNYFGHVQPQRSFTAPPEPGRVESGYGDIVDEYSAPQRAGTAGPQGRW